MIKLIIILVLCAQALVADKVGVGVSRKEGAQPEQQGHDAKVQTAAGRVHQVGEKPTIPQAQRVPPKVQQIAQQAQQHIPVVISHHVMQQAKKGKEPQSQQQQHIAAKTTDTARTARGIARSHMPRKSKRSVMKHRVTHQKRAKRASAPSYRQQGVQQEHQQVPHVINRHQPKDHEDTSGLRPPRKCDYDCTHLDLSVCATNDQCWTEFESICKLSTWNCLNTQKIFHQVADAECKDSSKPTCYPGDM